MSLTLAGGLRVDYIITAAGEVRLREMGGNALYAASGARLWVDKVELLAKVGENFPAGWLARMNELGLGTDGIRQIPGSHEQRTFYAYADPHTRIDRDPAFHFARVGHPLPPELEDYEHSLVDQRNQQNNPTMLREADIPDGVGPSDMAHIAPMGIVSQWELARGFKERGLRQLTLDPGEYAGLPENVPLTQQMCSVVDAFLPSELEVNLLLGSVRDPREAAEAFGAWGAPLVVIKRGAAGVLLYERERNRFTTVPAYPAKVVDVTGAGDTFCGGFAVGLQRTGDPLRAAMMGIVSASFTIESYGALHTLGVPRPAAEKRLEALAQAVGR